MNRRQFLATSVAGGATLAYGRAASTADERTFASPAEAGKSPPEKLAYVIGVYTGTGVAKPDYLATVDVDLTSKTYSQVIHRLRMPNVGDELHHFGWNACASCHGQRARRFLIIPALGSARTHI